MLDIILNYTKMCHIIYLSIISDLCNLIIITCPPLWLMGCVQSSHAAGPGSIPGRDKLPRWGFFWGFSSPLRQMSGNFRPLWSPDIIWPSLSSSSHPRLVWSECVCEWCVSSYVFVLSRRWPRHWADHSSGEALHVLVWSKKYVCDPKIIPLPTGRGPVRPGRLGSLKS